MEFWLAAGLLIGFSIIFQSKCEPLYRTKIGLLKVYQIHMELLHVLTICLLVKLASSTAVLPTYDKNVTILTRRKRYIVFPQGSTFSIAFCMSFKTLGTDDIFTGGMNLQVSYKLPNETIHHQGTEFLEPPAVFFRRRRRELYQKLEIVFSKVGVDGRACMLRTLCEAAQRLLPRGSLVSELLRVIFTLPLDHVRSYEPSEHHLYDAAHREGLAAQDCPSLFPHCPVSLLDMALGRESSS